MTVYLQEQFAKMKAGDPPPADAGIFGMDIPEDQAQLTIIPVPFEATTSYGGGTSKAPKAMIPASHQLDLFDLQYGEPYLAGITCLDNDKEILSWNQEAKAKAQAVIQSLEAGEAPDCHDLKIVNEISKKVNQRVYEQSKQILTRGSFAAVLGGDHSCPLGLIRALADKFDDFGILHIDAHHDLRVAYEGFEHSHASILHNVLMEIPQVSKIVSMGIRDFSQGEAELAKSSDRVETLYDCQLNQARMEGAALKGVFEGYLKSLPKNIYISFDIDGLEPSLCPNTGTPVPGGLRYNEACYILELLIALDHKIIGFDLCELSPGEDEWDLNVGARVLYKLCGALVKSQGLKPLV